MSGKEKSEKKAQKQLEQPTEEDFVEILKKKFDEVDGRLNTIETRLANQAIKLNQIQDAVESLLAGQDTIMQTQGPPGKEVEPLEWNPDKINWQQATGRSSGKTYERSDDVNNPDFQNLLEELRRNNNKLTDKGMFYWKFENSDAIGRTKSRYPKKK